MITLSIARMMVTALKPIPARVGSVAEADPPLARWQRMLPAALRRLTVARQRAPQDWRLAEIIRRLVTLPPQRVPEICITPRPVLPRDGAGDGAGDGAAPNRRPAVAPRAAAPMPGVA